MRSISYLPHTADVRIKLEADSLQELFVGGAEAISHLLKPRFCKEAEDMSIWHMIEVKARDTTLLLIDFLSELLTLCHLEKVIFCDYNIVILHNNALKATLKGKPADGFREDIKAITYHEADVHKNESGMWETIIIVDI